MSGTISPNSVPTGADPQGTAVSLTPITDSQTCGSLTIGWLTVGPSTTPVDLFALNATASGGRPDVTPVPIAQNVDLSQGSYVWSPVALDPGQYLVQLEGLDISATSSQFGITLGNDISCLGGASVPSDPASSTGPSATPTSGSSSTDSLSQSITSPSATAPPSNSSSTTSSGMKGGAVAGIVIGILAGVLAIFLLSCFLRRRVQQRSKRAGGDGGGSRWKNLGSVDLNSASGGIAAGLAPAAVDGHASGSSSRPGGRSSPESLEEKYGFTRSGSSVENGDGFVPPLPFHGNAGKRGSGGSGGGHYQRATRPSNPTPMNTNLAPMAPTYSDPPVSRPDAAGTPARNGRRKAVPKYDGGVSPVESHEMASPISPARSNPDLRHQGSFTLEKPVHYIMPDLPSQPRS